LVRGGPIGVGIILDNVAEGGDKGGNVESLDERLECSSIADNLAGQTDIERAQVGETGGAIDGQVTQVMVRSSNGAGGRIVDLMFSRKGKTRRSEKFLLTVW